MSTGAIVSKVARFIAVCGLALGACAAFAQAPLPGGSPGAPPVRPPEDPLMLAKVRDAAKGEIRLMVTAAFMGPVEAVRKDAEKAIGRKIFVEYGSARGNLKDEILGGQPFEVAILLPDVNAELLKSGKIVAGEHEVAAVQTAVAIRGDAAVDVSTPAGLKKALLGASAVRYSPTGVAYPTVRKLFADLGIAGQVKDVSRQPPSFAPLPAGQYEINLFPQSEVMRMQGVRNLGLVIAPFQVPEHINAVIGASANDRGVAEALVAFLQSSALDAAVRDAGMVRD